jgi:uncharacterized heparinase superfamily protein
MRGAFCSPARRRTSLLDSETFCFLNQSGALAELGWDSVDSTDSVSKLWRYNQHYFDDLNAIDAAQRSDWHGALLIRWVENNPSGRGVGWDPYPTSLRIVNWVKWQCSDNVLPDACVKSLAMQARWLEQRIEWHILGNHLFANAKALVFAGLFISGKEADRWLAKGLKIIEHELPEQVLADGGNFERSPMYHAIFLEDLLDLINLSRAFPDVVSEEQISDWTEVAGRMLNWLEAMTHPDGEVAFFNDAAIGVAPSPAELFDYADRLGIKRPSSCFARVTQFADSGYVRIASGDVVTLLDVAPIGPDYLPGHAHADTLSFEFSLFGQRVFVNGGTSEYGAGEIRQAERGTAAHNTVEINGENSSEVWGGFRVARRAHPRDLMIDETPESVVVSCAHDGYTRLPGKPKHRRIWQFSESSLVIEDRVEGSFKKAFSYFHLHPSVKVSRHSSGNWVLQLPQGQKVFVSFAAGEVLLVPSHYAPEFGQRFETQCFKVELNEKGARTRFDWGLTH